MKATSIFGELLRPTHELILFLNTPKGVRLFDKSEYDPFDHVTEAAGFLSRPLEVGYFVRPKSPSSDQFLTEKKGVARVNHKHFEKALEAWENWQPLFDGFKTKDNGEFYYVVNGVGNGVWTFGIKDGIIGYYSTHPEITSNRTWYPIGDTLNDFTTHCFKQGIELRLNPMFEL